MEKIKNSILPVDKSFGLATFQEVILLSLYKHLVRWTENNLDIVQDYHLAKLFNSPIPEYFNSLWPYKTFAQLNTRTKYTVINEASINSHLYWNIDTVLLFTKWSRVLSCVQVGFYFIGYSIGYYVGYFVVQLSL